MLCLLSFLDAYGSLQYSATQLVLQYYTQFGITTDTIRCTLDPSGLGLENANIFNKYQPIVNIEALYM